MLRMAHVQYDSGISKNTANNGGGARVRAAMSYDSGT